MIHWDFDWYTDRYCYGNRNGSLGEQRQEQKQRQARESCWGLEMDTLWHCALSQMAGKRGGAKKGGGLISGTGPVGDVLQYRLSRQCSLGSLDLRC